MALPATTRENLQLEVEDLRTTARARVSEVDLLVAALRDNLRDLRIERDRLSLELERAHRHINALHERQDLAEASWLWRGMKSSRRR